MLNEVGDEFHYMLVCPFFCHQRERYIPTYYFSRPNVLKFKELLSTENFDLFKNIVFLARSIIEHFKTNS
jgi:hypothetical protein